MGQNTTLAFMCYERFLKFFRRKKKSHHHHQHMTPEDNFLCSTSSLWSLSTAKEMEAVASVATVSTVTPGAKTEGQEGSRRCQDSHHHHVCCSTHSHRYQRSSVAGNLLHHSQSAQCLVCSANQLLHQQNRPQPTLSRRKHRRQCHHHCSCSCYNPANYCHHHYHHHHNSGCAPSPVSNVTSCCSRYPHTSSCHHYHYHLHHHYGHNFRSPKQQLQTDPSGCGSAILCSYPVSLKQLHLDTTTTTTTLPGAQSLDVEVMHTDSAENSQHSNLENTMLTSTVVKHGHNYDISPAASCSSCHRFLKKCHCSFVPHSSSLKSSIWSGELDNNANNANCLHATSASTTPHQNHHDGFMNGKQSTETTSSIINTTPISVAVDDLHLRFPASVSRRPATTASHHHHSKSKSTPSEQLHHFYPVSKNLSTTSSFAGASYYSISPTSSIIKAPPNQSPFDPNKPGSLPSPDLRTSTSTDGKHKYDYTPIHTHASNRDS